MRAAESGQVDGDKKGMRGYESSMRMDMPIDCVEHVISFLSLIDVYKCRSVCMAWRVAADRVLSVWETLVIVKKQSKTRPVIADKNQIFLIDGDQAIKRLEQLIRLKKIFVTEGHFGEDGRAVVEDVVIRNVATLTLLHMRLERLPLDPKRPVVFSNLRDLECFRMDPDQVSCLSPTGEAENRHFSQRPAETSSGDADQFGNHRSRTRNRITTGNWATECRSLTTHATEKPDSSGRLSILSRSVA